MFVLFCYLLHYLLQPSFSQPTQEASCWSIKSSMLVTIISCGTKNCTHIGNHISITQGLVPFCVTTAEGLLASLLQSLPKHPTLLSQLCGESVCVPKSCLFLLLFLLLFVLVTYCLLPVALMRQTVGFSTAPHWSSGSMYLHL